MTVGALARSGRDALAAADWDRARQCFEEAYEVEQSAEVLDGLARALHFLGEYARATELSERAFLAYSEADRYVEAADCARWLAFLHGVVHGNMAVANGWMGRAATLLEGREECAGHGWLVLDHAPFSDDYAERERMAVSAMAIARRFGDTDLEYNAMSLLGEAKVGKGKVAEGMKLLDQAMTAVSSGEVKGVVAVSDILCRLLSACERSLEVQRAQEWMAVALDFSAWRAFVSPVCRTHYGGILVAVGRWAEAEDELTTAMSMFANTYRGMAGMPLAKLGDLRVRQGRFEEAERLAEGYEQHPLARRILARVAFGRGDAALAEELVQLCLEGDEGSDPGCAPLLDLLVQVRLSRGDVDGAAEVVKRLDRISTESRDEHAKAFADLAAGRVAAASGADDATGRLQAALRAFADLQLPLEAGRAQLQLAAALAAGAPEAAEGEARRALDAFERLGAAADADAAGALLRTLSSSGRAWPKRFGALTKRETEVLSLLGEGCSNAQIAERLVISRRTAEHHVASILSKLDLQSRSEAAAYAIRARAHEDS